MPGNWTASATPSHASKATPAPTPGSVMAAHPPGPPYPLKIAIVGGVPTPLIDDPISGVFMLLFLSSAAAHMAILKINKRRGLKFLFSGMLFALCMLRSIALASRIAWASHPHNASVGIAASILTQLGSILIFIVNLFFAQRIVRAYHPTVGWHMASRVIFISLIACVVLSLIMLIVATLQSIFTLNSRTRESDHIVQLFAGTFLAFLAFLPALVALFAAFLPRRYYIEKFGSGRWRSKLGLLIFTSCVATLGAAFRVSTGFNSRSAQHPAWFDSRACYYCFNYLTDLIVSTTYLLARFDKRFIVPDGAKQPGDYRAGIAKDRVSNSSPDQQPEQQQEQHQDSMESEEKDATLKKKAKRDTGFSDRTLVASARYVRSPFPLGDAELFGPGDVVESDEFWDARSSHSGRDSYLSPHALHRSHHRHGASGSDPYASDRGLGDSSSMEARSSIVGAERPGNLLTMIDMIDMISQDGSASQRTSQSLERPRPAFLRLRGRSVGASSERGSASTLYDEVEGGGGEGSSGSRWSYTGSLNGSSSNRRMTDDQRWSRRTSGSTGRAI